MNLSKWRVTLPLFPPAEVLDNSTTDEYGKCPRKGFYRYGLRRGFSGKSFPIQFGLAYHKFREVVENLMREGDGKMSDGVHLAGIEAALEDWEDPPMGHNYEFLDKGRFLLTTSKARTRIELEQASGDVEITRAEDSFDLELPFLICRNCGWAEVDLEAQWCPRCNDEALSKPGEDFFRARHGGRTDQFLKTHDKSRVRDFKTTRYKGDKYEDKFSPNSQIQGYVWSGGELSGRTFDGALIETVHNTKLKGPEISQFYISFTKGQQEQWIASRMMEHSVIHMYWSRVAELGFLAFPQRTSECSNFGGCGFREACQSSSGREIENWLDNYTIESHWDFTDPGKEESKVK